MFNTGLICVLASSLSHREKSTQRGYSQCTGNGKKTVSASPNPFCKCILKPMIMFASLGGVEEMNSPVTE